MPLKPALCLAALTLGANALGGETCEIKDHAAYTAAIRSNTTEKYFSTELVDHLPYSSCVPAPDTYLGHIIGAPDVLDHVEQINGYMRLLASKSPRVRVFSMGKSEEGREMILAAIADEATIGDLDRYRKITARLADPRGLSESEAQSLIGQGKPIYWADGSIHSPESGSPEMLMELAYRLAVEETPMIETIRKNAIVLLTPVIETDGRDRFVDVYMYAKHHPEAMTYPLTWWGHYVGHDNNRDGITLSLALSKNVTRAYLDWHATVMHDLHESIPYLYISTGTGPYNAWLDPIVTSEWQQLAYYEVEELTRRGVVGVWTHGFYDGWAPNYLIWAATGHNAIGRFYETFGNRGADTQTRTLQPAATSREWFRPNPPLAKVKWSARDNINMQESGLLLGLYNVAAHGQDYLRNFYLKSQRAVAKARTEGPAAWVLPADETRTGDQARLVGMLMSQAIEVSRMDKPFAAAEVKGETALKFPAGSYVIRMDQPYSRLADTLLDTQYFSAKDPRPYDDTGWTLGALANVKTVRVMDAAVLGVAMTRLTAPPSPVGGVQGAGHTTYLINHNTDSALATFRFRLAKVPMEAAEESFPVDGRKFNRGTLVIADAERSAIETAAHDLGLTVLATDAKVTVARHALEAPRIALLHNWTNTQADGWFRITLDQLQIPYTYLADTRVRETANLREQFDAIVMPPFAGELASAIQGIPMQGSAMAWKSTPETPSFFAPGLDSSDDIRGGLGYSGVANLERFVREGGLLIAVGESAALPVEGGMTRAVSLRKSAKLVCPGGVLLAKVEDAASPIAYGYGDQLDLYYSENPVIQVGLGFGGAETSENRSSGRGSATDPDVIQGRVYAAPEKAAKRTPRERELYVPEEARAFVSWRIPPAKEMPRVILRFAEAGSLLVSGLLDGGADLAEKPAVVDVPHGQGHIVLFANNPMWRNETSGSHFLLFNALMNYRHLDRGR